MVVYLAGENGKTRILNNLRVTGTVLPYKIAVLESFYYLRNNTTMQQVLQTYPLRFLLDSGAFTFMFNAKRACDWDKYTDAYADFVSSFKIERFIEMDIDQLVGLKEVERLRRRLEQRTGRQPIPVWHINRGRDYFTGMVKDYQYVAFGGLMSDGVPTQKLERYFPWYIKTAHLAGCKIHGLGYTSLKGLHKYHFDSVDSTAWLYGNRSGTIYKFNPRIGSIEKIKIPAGRRLKGQEAAAYNFFEWVKFQQYAEKHL